MDRRTFLRTTAAAGAVFVVSDSWRAAYAQDAHLGPGPYGSLDGIAPDANGVILPPGFTSRVLAVTGQPVPGTDYVWHGNPDGGATFAAGDGWIYVSNSELTDGRGGVGAIEFDADGEIVSAYRILGGTSQNCAGGPTPWGTWLSCEEYDLGPGNAGQVWECDPAKPDGEGTPYPAMGRFNHEAVAVDRDEERLYLTEDQRNGFFYRYTPEKYPDLAAGLLEAAVVDGDTVTWVEVPDPSASTAPTRSQVSEATIFDGGEGLWFDGTHVIWTTKNDNKVHTLEPATSRYEVIYDWNAMPDSPLAGIDNITMDGGGDLFVCEDSNNMELGLITPEREVAPFLRIDGHDFSELAGAAFNPGGDRLYVSSQRGLTGTLTGMTFEITGPFRNAGKGSAGEAPSDSVATTIKETAAGDGSSGGGRSDGDDDSSGALGIVLPVGGAALAVGAGAYVVIKRRNDASR